MPTPPAPIRGALLTALLAAALLVPAAPASAKRLSFPAARERGTAVTFQLHGVRSASVARGWVAVGSYRRRLAAARIRRAARRGVLRIRMGRRARRARRRSGRRPRLVVVTRRLASPPTPRGTAATLVPPRSAVLSDGTAAARVRRSGFEPRSGNAIANARVPTEDELQTWRDTSNYKDVENASYYLRNVTGAFRGTTDEILQWVAWKWGFDEDMVRAQAVDESDWLQSEVGDHGVSFGILQLKSTKQDGTFPLSRDSTPFNADYAMMMLRHCYDGYATWLGNGYQAGDIWGCLGYYFSGHWYDDGAKAYIDRVREILLARPWQKPGF